MSDSVVLQAKEIISFKLTCSQNHNSIKLSQQDIHINVELSLKISEGDEQAFSVFFNHHYPLVRPFVIRFFKDQDQIEDAMQEVFIRVWLNRDKLPAIENVVAWLRTITSHVCINALRKDITREMHYKQSADFSANTPTTPAESFLASEIRKLVSQAVEKMPPARRRIYLLSRAEGLKPVEIAAELSLSVNTVRNVLVSALKEIREYLIAHGHLISLFFLSEFFFHFQ